MTDANPSAPRETSYDRMAYFGHAFEQTHPDRLATIAALHGMEPAPVPGCRVLELGCGDGGNLIPMAYQWPESEFLGIDLSERAVERARGCTADLGLRNIRLLGLDIMEFGAGFGQFDYVIAHGVYSWVPPPVRTRMMAIFREVLAPAGVAYVSYNAYPGSHLRDVARDMMQFHVRDIPDPHTRVEQARALLKVLAELSDEKDLYGTVLRDEWKRVRGFADSHLFHDDLNGTARAFYLHEVVEAAVHHGLQYLSDAAFSALAPLSESGPVANMISQIPESDAVMREQYLDFIKGCRFRQTLLCHRDANLRRHIVPQCIKDFHIAANVMPAAEEIDPGKAGVARFKTGKDNKFSTDHGLSKAALLHLGSIWPRAVGFRELVERACVRLGTSPAGTASQPDIDALVTILFRLVSAGPVTLHLCPPRLTTALSDRPQASLLARKQAAVGPVITTLRHNTVWIEDEIVRRFLGLVDGTRTLDQLVHDFNASSAEGASEASAAGADGGSGRPEMTRNDVERNLSNMARLALLVA